MTHDPTDVVTLSRRKQVVVAIVVEVSNSHTCMVAGSDAGWVAKGKSRSTLSGTFGSGLRPQLLDLEVLTVIPSAAAPGDFRPCYASSGMGSKTSPENVSDVNFNWVTSLPLPAGFEQTNWNNIESLVDGVWYEAPGLVDPFVMRHSRPINVMADYGRDVQAQYYEALLHVMLAGDVADKKPTIINLVQIGIDRAEIATADPATFTHAGSQIGGGHYAATGGHGCGAKFSICFASWLLNDVTMRDLALPAQNPAGIVSMGWQEDDQVFIVNGNNFNQCGYGLPATGGYVLSGTPEWGIKHYRHLREFGTVRSDDAHWVFSEPLPNCPVIPVGGVTPNVQYRTCCTANVWWMGNLFSRVTRAQYGLQAALYRPEFYHYAERYLTEMAAQPSMPDWTTFWKPKFKAVWEEYNDVPSYAIPAMP
ncbi:MAG: hypothetical protein ACI9EF_002993 [Pseudohongiellaceae bacterium]|jgi:hypothetical protein